MFYVYVLQSEQTGTYYIGTTSNIKRRIKEHNNGKTFSTKSKRPWHFLGSKEFYARGEAMKFEKYLKSLKKRKVLEEKIKHF